MVAEPHHTTELHVWREAERELEAARLEELVWHRDSQPRGLLASAHSQGRSVVHSVLTMVEKARHSE